MGNQASTTSVIQKHIQDRSNQDHFIASMSGTNPKFSDSLLNTTTVLSQAAPLDFFCFFTKGPVRVFRYWQLRHFFVCSMQVANPQIRQNFAIVHTYQNITFLSAYIDQAAFSNMVFFMDYVPRKLSREEYILRLVSLAKNKDPSLIDNIYPTYKIKIPQPQLSVAIPTLYGRKARPYGRADELMSTPEIPSSALNSALCQTRDIKFDNKGFDRSAPSYTKRKYDNWTTGDSQSSYLNPISEPSSMNDSGSSSKGSSISSSFANTISEPGPSDSQISEMFKGARKIQVHLHNHHNLHNDSDTSVSITDSFFSAATSATGSSAYKYKRHHNPDSRSSSSHSQKRLVPLDENLNNTDFSGSSRSRSRKSTSRSEKLESSAKSQKSSSSRPVAHIFSDVEDDSRRSKNSFYSESMYSANGTKRKRNVGLDVDLHHDMGFSNSESRSSRSSASRKKRTGYDVDLDRDVDTQSEGTMSSTGRTSKKRSVGLRVNFHHDVGFTSSENSRISHSSSSSKKKSRHDNYGSDAAMSSNGRVSKRKRNIGFDVDFHHDVGFTSSESK